MRDSGYFSRMGSKTNTTWTEMPDKEGEEYFSRRTSFKSGAGGEKYVTKGLEYGEDGNDDKDDGYFSRRGSRKEVAEEADNGNKGEDQEDPGYFSRQNSTVSGIMESLQVLGRGSPTDSDVQFTLVAEGTPCSTDGEPTLAL